LETEGASAILEEGVKQDMALDAYLHTLLQANYKSFWEASEMLKKETFEEFFTKVGIIPEWSEDWTCTSTSLKLLGSD
jgi:ribosomal protein RSM22 (predicted rRNA methylase)